MKRCCLFLLLFLLIMVLLVQAATQSIADGQYRIAVTLSGGTGRVKVESPAKLTVTDGAATAVVIWSSPNYEYMLVDGNYYYPVHTDRGSTFEIPVWLDQDMAVSAQTVAMSEPHEIDYTLHFDSATIEPLPGNEPAPTTPMTPPSATPTAPTPTTPVMMAAIAAAVLIALTAAGLLMAAWKRSTKQHKATKEK
ncbi:MAG TPA: hypothetical protein VN441_09670 [Syntrophomonas sp.]|nr:hypothetical protein [Syntrophomonas sp.]